MIMLKIMKYISLFTEQRTVTHELLQLTYWGVITVNWRTENDRPFWLSVSQSSRNTASNIVRAGQ